MGQKMTESEAQREAISHDLGPAIVLAGPGSGKTFVITNRIRYLIEQCGANPYNILVITFTKAAATEMKERFIKMYGSSGGCVNFGTFHAIFFTVLKYAYNYTAANIIMADKKQQLLKEIIDKYKIETEDEKELLSSIEAEISLVKGERISPDNYYSTSCSEDVFRKIYLEYNDRLRKTRLLDFDDMIVQCYDLFKQHPEILEIWQKKFEYILIDEFQDINILQYEIVRMLAKPNDNLFIVGDDDQSIYRFRGAKPEIMLNFSKDYPNAKQIILDVNYRSTKCIVESAGKVIKNNINRFNKNITTINPEGEPVKIVEYNSTSDENRRIVNEILEYNNKGIPLSEISILYRTNTQPRAIIEKLMEYNIPFSIKDTLPGLYDHWISKNILNYIECARQYDGQINTKEGIVKKCSDRSVLLNVMNRPNRYIGRDSLKDIIIQFDKLKSFYSNKDWMVERIEKLEYDLAMIAKMKPHAAINYIRNGIGYDDYLKEYATFKKINEDDLFEVLDELTEGTKEFETYDDWLKHIEDYNRKLMQQAKDKNANKESVSLTTFHGSKGLEYDVVFIIDANEGITPHKKSLLEADMEEERRMFYVAMTRARKWLHIYYVKERFKKSLEISRFVGEIFVDKSQLVKGTVIEHAKYGVGTIDKRIDNKITVKFVKIPIPKTLSVEFCVNNRLVTIIDCKK